MARYNEGMNRRIQEQLIVWLLLVIWGLIVLHAPLTVWFVSHGAPVYIKAWKEVLMLIASVLLLVHTVRLKKLSVFMRDPLVWGATTYGLLNLIMVFCIPTTPEAALAGLAINLRYVLYFMLVYVLIRLHPEYRTVFLRVGLMGAGIVVGFAVLQLVLPYDVLKYLGYSSKTIVPYLTVDGNSAYIRENSTLRGPNPLGAYAGSAVILIVAYMTTKWSIIRNSRQRFILIGLLIASTTALWVSYSRSALITTVIGAVGVLWIKFKSLTKRTHRVLLVLSVVLVLGFGWMVRGTSFVQNVILHDDPHNGSGTNSNSDHLSSLRVGVARTVAQPFGAGVGSTGSASLLSDSGLIIENQYLMIAHEVGWLGLGLFIWLNYLVMVALWHRRASWLALGVWASGLGLMLIGLVLPVWVDDTVSIVWWGLAALVIARQVKGSKHEAKV